MLFTRLITYCKRLSILAFCLFLCSACEKEQAAREPQAEQVAASKPEVSTPQITVAPTPATPSNIDVVENKLQIGNTRYLFVAAEHTPQELQALLERVDYITQSNTQAHDELDIALVIHGNNVDFFIQENYEQNKPLIDLAAKLDAFNVLDMKVCEWSMSQRGVSITDLPSFVDPVPYAPDEIKKLQTQGYINL